MIIADLKVRDIKKEGLDDSKKMTISKNSDVEAHIVKILTENYRFPIESHVREAVSNHWDSHVEAGKPDEPIFVKIYKNNQTANWVFETSDTGLGLSEEDFYRYYMQIGESSKKDKPHLIGGMGCGAKAILSYTDKYTVICRKNGIENKFIVYKGEEFPECTKVYEKSTEEQNGVIIRIDIDYYSISDFKKAIKQQLCYFPTVIIDIENDNFNYNNCKIYENELFRWSEMYPQNELHISFGNVHYPIDWESLKINKIYLPLAIKIPIDSGIKPFFNRESLSYDAFCKEYIKNKIKELANYLVELYNSNWKEYNNILECWNQITETDKKVEIAGNNFIINSILSYSDNKPKELSVKGIKRDIEDFYFKKRYHFLNEYEKIASYEYSYWKTKKLSQIIFEDIVKNQKVILVNNVPVGKVKKHLLEKYKGNIHFVVKNQTRKLGNRHHSNRKDIDYIYCLGLYNHSKSEWRSIIQEWQYVENQFKERIIDERDVENTKEYQEWLEKDKEIARENRKSGYKNPKSNYKALNKQEGDITISVGRKGYTSSGVTFDKKVFKIEKLGNLYNSSKNLHIYFKEEDKEKAAKYFKTFGKKYTVCIIGKRESGKIKNNKQFMNEEQFLGSTKFGKLMSAIKYEEAIDTYDNLKNNKIVKEVLKSFYKDYEIVKKYVDDNIKEVDESLMTILQEAADKGNIYDKSIEDVYIRFKDSLKKYDFIDCLKVPNYWNNQETDKYRRLINCMLLTKSKYNNYENLDIIVEAKKEEELEQVTV